VFEPVDGQQGIITAGTSSGITDGGAAVVLASSTEVKARSLTPLARVSGWTTTGVDPRIMGIGPVPAVRKLLDRTGLRLDDFDLVEINEAFAPQVLAVLRDLPIDPARVNVNGGAIALGHPIGRHRRAHRRHVAVRNGPAWCEAGPRDPLRQRRTWHGHGGRTLRPVGVSRQPGWCRFVRQA
jgi:hypothetical protein